MKSRETILLLQELFLGKIIPKQCDGGSKRYMAVVTDSNQSNIILKG